MIRIGLLGAQGRMGLQVQDLLQSEFSDSASLVSKASKNDSLLPLLETDVVIDFSSPAAMESLAQLALQHPGPLPAFVVGSTGWTSKALLIELSKRTSVLVASNFSAGVFLMSEILKEYSGYFKKLGYTPQLVETHHCHKKDSPSGTAFFLQQSMRPYQNQEIQIHSIRAGEVIGDHEVIFYGASDQIHFQHHAQNRSIFARGAIQVALWLSKTSKPNLGIMGLEHYFKALKEG